MIAIRRILPRLAADQRGATAIEYGLIIGLMALAMIGALSELGGGAGGMWTNISDSVANAS
ncbi:MAG: Flp family type IVb pilin [Sphingomicrobium sp.]